MDVTTKKSFHKKLNIILQFIKAFTSLNIALFLFLFLNLTLSTFGNSDAQSKETELEEIFAIFTEEEIVISALKKPRSVLKSPAIISVINARQIKQMGFRTLVDVLRIVPGFYISMDETGVRNIGVRGILDNVSQKVKILIDGHSVNNPWTGGATWSFDDLVVENIKRIEVIRGPGSALYGQNAFLAVVNVITKDTEDIDGFQVTASGGSFDTQNYNLLFGREFGDLKISGFFDYFDTEGFSKKIEQDIIQPPDSGSMAPGRSQNEKEKTDLNLKLSYHNLEIKGKYMHKRREGYIGIGHALNNETNIEDTYAYAELIYKLFSGEKLNVIPRVYYDYYKWNNVFQTKPDGFVDKSSALGVAFLPNGVHYPDGIKGLVGFKQSTIGFENLVNYKVFEGNELTFGFQYEWIHQGDVRSDQYTFDPTNNFLPISPVRDFSHLAPFARRSATRQIWAAYLQDEWNITKDIDLTVGVRYDHFTRFGRYNQSKVWTDMAIYRGRTPEAPFCNSLQGT